MKTTFTSQQRRRAAVWGLLCGLVALTSGCQFLSHAACSLGSFLDPHQHPCIDHVGNCALCGATPSGDGPGVVPASYTCPKCGEPGPPQVPPPAELTAQLEQLQADTAACREQMAEVGAELQQRGQLLIQTRGELARVQNDVMLLRSNVSQWQSSMQQIHEQIREREAQRNEMVNAMLLEVQKVVASNEGL